MSIRYKELFRMDDKIYGLAEDNNSISVNTENDTYILTLDFLRELQMLMVVSPHFWENANVEGVPKPMTGMDTQDPRVVAEIEGVKLKKPLQGKDCFVVVPEDGIERILTSEIFLYVLMRMAYFIDGSPVMVPE